MLGAGRNQLGGGKEEGGRGRGGLGFGVGLRIGIKRGPGRNRGVKGSDQVEWSRVDWGGIVTPPYKDDGKEARQGKLSSSN